MFFLINQQLTSLRRAQGASQEFPLPLFGVTRRPHLCPWATLAPSRYLPAANAVFARSRLAHKFLRKSYKNPDLTTASLPETETQLFYSLEKKALTRNPPPEGFILPVR